MARKKTPPTGPDPSAPPPPGDDPAAPGARAGKKAAARPKRAAKPRQQAGDPPSRALDLMIRAAETFDPKRRAALAKEALEISPDCAEAYLLLAEQAPNRRAALRLFEQAVAAAERSLGPALFAEGAGHFWGLLETRPYMRARAGLAEATWAAGRRDEAVAHLREMLRLNPGDNQGLRYLLAGWLLNLDRLADLDELLDRYDEDSATWSFTRALAAFRAGGDSPAARKLLKAARRANKHVVAFLTGKKDMPPEPPPYYSPGDEDDAVLYVANHLGAWKATPGALTWIKGATARKPRKPRAEGPSEASGRRLLDLPAEVDTWQADFRQFDRRIEVGGERVRPWMVLVSSRSREQVLGHAMVEREPTAEALWDIVAGAMERPLMGEPHRPSEIQVRADPAWEALEAPLEAIGVACAPAAELDQIDFLFENLARHLDGSRSSGPPGLLDMPGATPERVGRFYEAAAGFYRRAPWRALGYEAIIQVECDRYDSGPWYAVVMGQSGLTLGVALYEDLALLRRMYAGKLSDEEGARRTVALTVTFDDEASLGEVDLEAIEAHGWPIASPEAYPSFFRKERGLSMRPPLAWEVDLMVACLAALPDFIARRPIDDTTRELVAVADAAGARIEVGLAWLPESG